MVLVVSCLMYRSNTEFPTGTKVNLKETNDDHDHTERDDQTRHNWNDHSSKCSHTNVITDIINLVSQGRVGSQLQYVVKG